jgi:hypothetical protein
MSNGSAFALSLTGRDITTPPSTTGFRAGATWFFEKMAAEQVGKEAGLGPSTLRQSGMTWVPDLRK